MASNRKRSLSGPAESTPTKRKRYLCTYQQIWEKEFPWVKKSDRGQNEAFCILCNVHLNIGSGAKNDLSKHSKTQSHAKNASAQKSSKSLTTFMPSFSDFKSKVNVAETLFANFLAEHNLPFSVSDHFTKLCKKMFPDSKIAENFACGRTKSTQIIKRAISPSLDEDVTLACQSKPFTILCDESNDFGSDKNFVILVKFFCDSLGHTVTRFLNMPVVNIGTAENLFKALEEIIEAKKIPWSNVFGFMSDNCSVMKGRKNSVLSRIQEKQPHVMNMGCICHLANICCGAAVKTLPMSPEDLIIDIYSHFKHSSKRKEEYKEFLEFQDVDPLKILKHVSTRWLSLHKCVTRTIHHWPALLSYFKSHKDGDKDGRVKRVADQLENPEMKMYFQFLEFILTPLSEFNTAFQASASRIGQLREAICRLLRKFLGKFLKASAIASYSDLTKVPFLDISCQLDDDLLAIGLKNRELLQEQPDLPMEKEKRFFRVVRQFYETVVGKIIKKFPFDDPVLKSIGFINPLFKTKFQSDCVTQLVNRFPGVLKQEEVDLLEDQYIDYLLASKEDLPPFEEDIDMFWHEMQSMVDSCTQKPRFDILAKLAKTLLVLPNSNADSERAFSIIKKIHTEFRSELNNETLNALLSCKFNQPVNCYKYTPTSEVLKNSKSAAVTYNASLK